MKSPKLYKALMRGGKQVLLGPTWLVPLIVSAAIVTVLVSGILTIAVTPVKALNAQDVRHTLGKQPTQIEHEAARSRRHLRPPELKAPKPDPNLQRIRTQMPFYTECFQTASIQAGPLVANGTCEVLHEPPTSSILYPTEAFRKEGSLTIDASRCGFYMKGEDELSRKGQAMLQPMSIQLRPASTDHDVFLQIYCGQDFMFLRKLADYVPLNRPVTVLDAGANVGLASIMFAQAIRFNGQVVAVDANPGTMQVMKQNTAFLGDVVLPVEAAIVDTPTAATTPTLTFSGMSNQYWGFRVDHQNWTHPTKVSYEVNTRSLRDLARMTTAGKFDFIKLDVEGEEKHLLRDQGSHEVLCEARCVFMELHERFEPGCNAAFRYFLGKGCGGGEDDFVHITTTGEYMLFCKGNAAHSLIA